MHLGAAWSETYKGVEILIEKLRVERPSFSVKLRISYSRRRLELGRWGKLGDQKEKKPDLG